MIEQLTDMPDGTLGFRAVGRVEEDDYRTVLLPPVHAALAAGRVRILYVLDDDYDSYSPGAMWEDTRLGLGHLSGWDRIALVTSHRWLRDAARAFAWLMPGEARVFEPDRLAEAKEWLAS